MRVPGCTECLGWNRLIRMDHLLAIKSHTKELGASCSHQLNQINFLLVQTLMTFSSRKGILSVSIMIFFTLDYTYVRKQYKTCKSMHLGIFLLVFKFLWSFEDNSLNVICGLILHQSVLESCFSVSFATL